MQELFNAVPELKFYLVVMELIFHAIGIGGSIYFLVTNIKYAVNYPYTPGAAFNIGVAAFMSIFAAVCAVLFYKKITAPTVDYDSIIIATLVELMLYAGIVVFLRAMKNQRGGM